MRVIHSVLLVSIGVVDAAVSVPAREPDAMPRRCVPADIVTDAYSSLPSMEGASGEYSPAADGRAAARSTAASVDVGCDATFDAREDVDCDAAFDAREEVDCDATFDARDDVDCDDEWWEGA